MVKPAAAVSGIVNNRNRFIAASELLWLKRLLGELGGKSSEIPMVYVENASAVKLAKNTVFHRWSKHVEVRYYFVPGC